MDPKCLPCRFYKLIQIQKIREINKLNSIICQEEKMEEKEIEGIRGKGTAISVKHPG